MTTYPGRFSILAQRVRGVCTAVLVLLLTNGCASLDKEECLVADWRLIGYQDGAAGKAAGAVGRYREDCAQHAVVPDLDQYRAGRAEGLQEYCRPYNGFRLGKAGKGYPTVCPSGIQGELRAAYDEGRDIYLAKSDVKKTNSRIHEHRQILNSLEEDKGYKLSELISDGLRSEQRILLLYEIHEIEGEIDTVSDEIIALEHDLEEQQHYLDHLRHQSSY